MSEESDVFDMMKDDEVVGGSASVGELKEITQMAERLLTMDRKIEEMEQKLKDMSEARRKLGEHTLPEKMMSIGLKEIKLEDGRRLIVDTFYSAKIPESRELEAFRWLEEHDCGSLIKNKVDVTLGKGEDDKAKEIVDFLEKLRVAYHNKRSVHPMTLKAFVKEQIESGNELDQELFGVYIGNKIKVK